MVGSRKGLLQKMDVSVLKELMVHFEKRNEYFNQCENSLIQHKLSARGIIQSQSHPLLLCEIISHEIIYSTLPKKGSRRGGA